MEKEIRIPITDLKHRIEVGQFYGASKMMDALAHEKSKFDKLPGYNAALAVAEAHLQHRIMRMYSHNTLTAARAGVDLSVYAISSLTGEEVICTLVENADEL